MRPAAVLSLALLLSAAAVSVYLVREMGRFRERFPRSAALSPQPAACDSVGEGAPGAASAEDEHDLASHRLLGDADAPRGAVEYCTKCALYVRRPSAHCLHPPAAVLPSHLNPFAHLAFESQARQRWLSRGGARREPAHSAHSARSTRSRLVQATDAGRHSRHAPVEEQRTHPHSRSRRSRIRGPELASSPDQPGRRPYGRVDGRASSPVPSGRARSGSGGRLGTG